MFGKYGNDKKPKIQSSGYNGSEPTRICPHCGQEKPLSDFGYRQWATVMFEISHGAKNAEVKHNKKRAGYFIPCPFCFTLSLYKIVNFRWHFCRCLSLIV